MFLFVFSLARARAYLLVIEAVFDFFPVHIYGIVVVFGVHDQAAPLSPAGRNVGSVVFVQILPEVACKEKKKRFSRLIRKKLLNQRN